VLVEIGFTVTLVGEENGEAVGGIVGAAIGEAVAGVAGDATGEA